MNTPILDLGPGIGALRGDLRPSELLPRAIHRPGQRSSAPIEDRR
jgi:hypothetical protein